MEGLLSAAAFDGDWDTYCTLRDKLCRTPHLFHDKIMNAFNLAIQHHNNDIAEDILSELNEINRLDQYGIRREGLLAAARAIDGVNLILADYILVINMPVHMLGTPLESACERGNVELVDQILKNLMESKPGALAEYEKFIVRRGTEQKHSPSSHVDNDRAFFLNEPMRICINAANWELCGVLLPSYIE
jgi:hypothetical protein